jgi:hypothetical protein
MSERRAGWRISPVRTSEDEDYVLSFCPQGAKREFGPRDHEIEKQCL